ncbi:MAG: hypothetical protein A2632_01915 [Candidatus Pacebacteria bacterium RIFCSPHIGHO2_01_FULL_46_16]|nr:MAG: hypothetical protein A2632_01915 [Candidatus Pacebacteria bacterium RIFCSPHIGHO2_01_FULL_46_16]OGJ20671.1 MAG: hypothetical protein A3J60_00610 [Candidatus Pacebacteria bacterium RIFCSPHIGHO2_02_FULL_46_9]
MISSLNRLAQFGSFEAPVNNKFSTNSATGMTAFTNLELLISHMFGVLTVFGGLFFIVTFLIAGINWVTAGGDKGKIEKARGSMVQGVLGLVVVVAAYAIIGVIGSVVGLNLLNPAESLTALVTKIKP